jgi:hypothetical protein
VGYKVGFPNSFGGIEARDGARPRVLAGPWPGEALRPTQLSAVTPHVSMMAWMAVMVARG